MSWWRGPAGHRAAEEAAIQAVVEAECLPFFFSTGSRDGFDGIERFRLRRSAGLSRTDESHCQQSRRNWLLLECAVDDTRCGLRCRVGSRDHSMY